MENVLIMGYSKEEQKSLRALGQQIRKYRLKAGYSQEDFAFECGLHRTYMGSVERGERNIAVLNLKKIAHTLKLSLSELVANL